jgi:hypothetical protein
VGFSGEPGFCRGARSVGAARGVVGSVTGAAAHPTYRDPAAVLIDQLKSVYIEAELELIDASI